MEDDFRGFSDREELTVMRLVAEHDTLKGRLRRYWKKLAKEGALEAKRRHLAIVVMSTGRNPEVFVTDEQEASQQGAAVIIERDSEDPDSIQDGMLLALARPQYPSLYRRFYQGWERWAILRDRMEELLRELEAEDSTQND